MSEQHYTQCENECPVSNLGCGKGRRYFGIETEGHDRREGRDSHHGHHASEQATDPIGLLRQCGHILHHGGGGSEMLGVLTSNEQAELEYLLKKLLEDWQRNMPSRHHH